MRYIGSKAKLLKDIESFIDGNIHTKQETFCDVFSGTAVVARHFKARYKVISNDFLYFSYIIQKAFIEGDSEPAFHKIYNTVGNPFSYLENEPISNSANNFIAETYSPAGKNNRMYFTEENARRIDFIRATIEKWRAEDNLTESEYYYLLASLLEAAPSISNTTGTYGAYLKKWDKRAFKKLELPQFEIVKNGKENEVYNENAFTLLKTISGDILYIDPPYNARQYAPNYHLLETIARYDNPTVSGVTGIRSYENQKSPFCSKSEVNDSFETLIKDADFSHIVLSYSSSGLMKQDFIERILKENCIASTYALKKIPYRKYKSKIYDDKDISEYLFYIQKKQQGNIYALSQPTYLNVAEPTEKYYSSPHASYTTSKKKYIKGPLNYIGGKYKLLPQIIPLFPKKISTFIDLFSGGCNVGVNADCEKMIFNDLNSILMNMFSVFAAMDTKELLLKIDETICTWNLSTTNEDAFIKFRKYYNDTRHPIDLYVLSCYSFNYQDLQNFCILPLTIIFHAEALVP